MWDRAGPFSKETLAQANQEAILGGVTKLFGLCGDVCKEYRGCVLWPRGAKQQHCETLLT